MARRLGRAEEARSWLEKAEGWWAQSLREGAQRRELRLPVPWWDFAELEILLREARRVVAGTEPADEADRWRLRARAHAELADLSAAAADLRHACERHPDDARLGIDLGRALIAAGRDDEADAAFRRAVGLRPGEAEPRIRCGRAWADSGRRERGAAYFDEAVALRPDDPIARVARGRFLSECGESGRADADFARAAVTAQDDPNIFLGGWWIAGPYPDASEPDTTRGPAQSLLATDAGGTREVPWRFLADVDIEPAGLVQDFRQTQNASAYAITFLFATRERDVTLLVTCDPSARLWLNGRLIREAGPSVGRFAPHRMPVTLRAGRNVLLARVANGLGEPRLSCRAIGAPSGAARAGTADRSRAATKALARSQPRPTGLVLAPGRFPCDRGRRRSLALTGLRRGSECHPAGTPIAGFDPVSRLPHRGGRRTGSDREEIGRRYHPSLA
jgi:tetratricopeptide (TPR) repeat protein